MAFLFSIEPKFQTDLDHGNFPKDLRQVFKTRGFPLPQNATVSIQPERVKWQITIMDKNTHGRYIIRKGKNRLDVHTALEIRTIDLTSNIPGGDSIEFLRAEVSKAAYRYSPFALVRYALEGVEQEYGLRIDLDKRVFIDHFDEDPKKEAVLHGAAPKIVKFLSRVLYPESNPPDRTELAKQLRAVAYLTGEFTLRSGKISSFYWDKYRFESDPILLHAIVAELEKLLPPVFDKFAGLELGGVPLATGLSLKTGKPCLYVRKEAKPYGTANLVEGGFEAGETVVVVEDVITTAGQVCTSVNQLRELGLVVEDVVCVIDRQQGGREKVEGIGCSLNSVFTLEELESLEISHGNQK
jgi:orotate phosphoribosyltransferase